MADPVGRPAVAGQLGANLRRLRGKAELSRDELAHRAECNQSQVAKIERGEQLCRVDTLVKLAASLGATPNDLLAGVDWRPRGEQGGGFGTGSAGGDGDAG